MYTWTKKWPTKPGFYWRRYYDECAATKYEDVQIRYMGLAEVASKKRSRFVEWSDQPIPFPKEPGQKECRT